MKNMVMLIEFIGKLYFTICSLRIFISIFLQGVLVLQLYKALLIIATSMQCIKQPMQLWFVDNYILKIIQKLKRHFNFNNFLILLILLNTSIQYNFSSIWNVPTSILSTVNVQCALPGRYCISNLSGVALFLSHALKALFQWRLFTMAKAGCLHATHIHSYGSYLMFKPTNNCLFFAAIARQL